MQFHIKIIVGFLMCLTLSQVVHSQEPCDTLLTDTDIVYTFANTDECSVEIGLENLQLEYDTGIYVLDIQYDWLLDGVFVSGTQTSLIASNDAINSTDLSVTIDITLTTDSTGYSDIDCSYSTVFSMQEIVFAYEHWSCDCQPGGPPVASFYVENEGVCGNLGVSFINTVTGGQGPTFHWQFGAGGMYGESFEASPTVDLYIPGGGTSVIPVTLFIEDDNGCTSSIEQMVSILEVPNPGNNFNIGNICTGNPNDVQAIIEFTPVPFGQGGIDQIDIDWGPVQESHTPPPFPTFEYTSPVYSDFGYYPITIELIGNNGCLEVISDSLFIGNNPQIGTANPGNTDGICGPYELTFPVSNFSSNDPSTTYEFDFGDGSTQIFNHPPPTSITHNYTSTSCGSVTPLGSENAFMFLITANNECGSSNTSVDPIRIHGSPDPNITGEPLICAGSQYLWQSESTGTWVDANSLDCTSEFGNWQITDPSSGFPVAGSIANPVFGSSTENFYTTFYEPGIYNIEVIESHPICDSDDDSFEVCVFPDQLDPEATFSIQSGCAPLTIDLEDITPPLICGQVQREWVISGGSYQWVSGGSTSESPTVTLLEGQNYQITLVHEPDIDYIGSYSLWSTCPIGQEVMNFNVQSAPSFYLNSSDYFLCEGQSVTTSIYDLNNGGHSTYDLTWYVNGVETNDVATQITLSNIQSGTITIEAVVTNDCGSFSDTEVLTVYDIPDVTVSTVGEQCYGENLVVNASGAGSYSWSNYNNLIQVNGSQAIYNVTSAQTEYVIGTTYYSNESCTSTTYFDISVLPLPQVSISGNSTACLADTFNLAAQVSSGTPDYTYVWSQTSLNNEVSELSFVANNSVNQVSLTVYDSNGCEGESVTYITVNELPFVEAGDNVQVCNQPFITDLDGHSPLGGLWSGEIVVDAVNGSVDPMITGVGTTLATYTYTDFNGCTNSDDLFIEIVEPVQANAGPDVVVCESDVVINLDPFPATGGTWDNPTIDSDSNLDISGFAPGTYTFTYEYGVGTCHTSDIVQVVINERPNVVWTASSQLCVGEEGDFDITISGGQGPYLIDWITNMSSIAVDGLSASNSWSTPGLQQVEVNVTDMNGCSTTSIFEVLINPNPIVFAGNDTTFCNQSIPGQLQGFSPGLFEAGVGVFYGIGDALLAVSATGEVDPDILGVGTFEVVYEFTNAQTGCVNSDTLLVEINDPQIAEAGSDLVVCNNSPIVQLEGYFPATGVVWSGSNAEGEAALVDTQTGLINPLLLSPGTHTYLIETGVGTCYSTDFVDITVDPLPVISLGSDDVFCSNDGEVPLTSFTPTGGTWEGPGVVDASAGTFDNAIGSGNYDLIYHYTDPLTQCSDTAYHEVLVQVIPTVFAGNDTTFCNQPIVGQLQGHSPGLFESGVGVFYGIGDALLAVSPTGEVDPGVLGVGIFEVVYEFTSAQTGCTNSDTLLVEINDPQVADAGSDIVVCNNAPEVQLEGYFPITGVVWSGSNAEGNNALVNNQTGVINPVQLSPGVHTYQLEYGVGTCYSTDFVDITVDPLPVISLGSDDVFCSNDGEVPLTSFTPTGGTWEGPGVVDASAGTFDNAIGSGNYDLIYHYTDPLTQCSDTAYHDVLVQVIPTVFAGNDTIFCNQPIAGQLQGFSPGLFESGVGVFYGIGDALLAVSPTGEVDPNVLGVGTFEVVYEFTSAQTGCTNSDTLEIVINDPLVANAGLDTVVCHNAPILQLEGFFPATGVIWSGSNAEGNAAIQNSTMGVVNPQYLSPGTHTYQIEYGVGTCYSTDYMNVVVNPLPVLSIGTDESFCGNLMIEDLQTASPLGGYWFGEIVSDPQQGFVDTSYPQGTYNTSYTYTDPSTLCADTVSKDVTIWPVPTADFSNDALGCTNIDLPITQLSSGADQYLWEFGNNESSNSIVPFYTYPDIGDYVITMYASNIYGCTDTTQSNVEITELPISSFTLSTDNGCAPLDVEVENNSYAPFSQFEWNSNGSIYTVEDLPIQTYSQGDSILNIELSLTTYNLCGSSVLIEEIDVYPQPQMDLVFFSDTACSPFTAEILNLSVGLPDLTTWDYGNGQSSTGEDPIFPTYIVDSLDVIFYATIYGENECGVDSAQAPILIQPNTIHSFFTTNQISGCPPLSIEVEDLSVATTNVSYDFGDGNYSLDGDANNSYTEEGQYILTQFATNGCSYDTSEVVITVHPHPEFSLSSQQQEYCEGETASFQVTTDNPGAVDWDFGDGETSSGLNVTHEFTDSGIYEVEATVQTNLWGCIDSGSLFIDVTPTPVLDVQVDTAYGCSPLTVEFLNESVDADFWLWNFGDFTPNDVSEAPTHLFFNNLNGPVSYDVQVQASTVDGCASTTTLIIDVLPEPIAGFDIPQELFCGLPNSAYMVNESSLANSYSWTLNGETVSSDENPEIEFSVLGFQTIELIASNLYGCVDNSIEIIEIHDLPQPQLLITPNAGCAPHEVSISDMSIGSIQSVIHIGNSEWDLYTGPIPNEPLSINYSGNYLVTLTTISADGCTSYLENPETIWVWPNPVPNFDIVPAVDHTSNTEFLFENLSQGYYSSVWSFGNGGISTDNSPYFNYDMPGQYPVTLTVSSQYGCVSTHSEMVIISSELEIYVPNAFTPTFEGTNSHGINDAFRPEFSDVDLIESYHLQIFNRWGDLVWETNDPEEYWVGGTSVSGLYYSQDNIYNWVMKIQSNSWVKNGKELRGFVTMIR